MRDKAGKIEIRDLDARLIVEVKQIEIECNLSPWSLEDYQSEILRQDSIALTAKYNDLLAGFLIARLITNSETIPQNKKEREAELYNIAVKKEFRNLGIGQALLDGFFLRARKALVSTIWLEVRETNLSAVAFYQKNEFAKIYTRTNFYQNPLENASVMSRELTFEK
jgi:[ribosomal protein S18]-alanine N-acetyltransferase